MNKKRVARNLMFAQATGFGLLILCLWMDEVFDLPHLLFGAPATPINWIESIFETVLALMLGSCTTLFSWQLVQHIKYLEGFLPVCSICKRIRVESSWIPIEDFISHRSEAVFSHGVCPECEQKYYPELFTKDQ